MVITCDEKMCARLLACPLCSQPRFLTLDALRAGLVSVATRPLMCPVCNEVLFGIDKLTIHLFGHTINLNNNAVESPKHTDVIASNVVGAHNSPNAAPQNWNILKIQESDKTQILNDGSCTRSDSEVSVAANKTSAINSQRAQSQDLSAKSIHQHTSVSDYNYDVIRVNISPQSSENYNIVLRPTANLQEVLKTKCATQYSRDDDIKYLNVSQGNMQTENTAVSDFSHNWMEKQSCNKSVAATVGNVDTNIYQSITEIESNNNQHASKERLINLMDKEKKSELSNFQLIQTAMPVCADSTSEKPGDKQSLYNVKETVLEINTEDQEQNSQGGDYRKILQTKILQAAAPKEKTERCNICGFHFSDVNILTLHQQLVHEQDLNISGKILKNYSCHLCSKVFKMRGSLMVHMRVAHIGHNLGKRD